MLLVCVYPFLNSRLAYKYLLFQEATHLLILCVGTGYIIKKITAPV